MSNLAKRYILVGSVAFTLGVLTGELPISGFASFILALALGFATAAVARKIWPDPPEGDD